MGPRIPVGWILGTAAAALLLLGFLLRRAGPAHAPGPEAPSGRPQDREAAARAEPRASSSASGESPAETRLPTARTERTGVASEELRRRREDELARLQGRVRDEGLDPMVRVQELKRLQIQASADPSVFTPELIQSVLRLIRTNPEPTVRAHAAGGLRGATSPEFRQAMIGLLQSDPSAGVRQSAADALAPANGHADVREALSRALERETEVHVRDQIRRSLNYVAPVDRLRKGS